VSLEVVCRKSNRLFAKPWLTAWWARCLTTGLALLLLGLQVHAAPQVTLEKQPRSLELRNLWESTLVDVPEQSNAKAFDPQDVWQWPAERFAGKQTSQRMVMTAKQRFVARMELVSSHAGEGVYLVVKMPRLDAVHVFYRYGNEPWTKESAGDTLPMTTWPFFDRQPTFDLPQRPGILSVVVEIAHQGVVDAPVLLESSNSFRQDGINASITSGLLIGVNLVLAAVGLMAALNFRRFGFLSISLMTLLMALVVFTNSGLAGVYLQTDSSEFNDQSKFLANTLLCVAFPWITAVALSQRFYSRGWWYVAMAWAALGALLGVWLMQYPLRHLTLTLVPFILAGSLLIALAMLVNALLRSQTLAVPAAPGIVLYAVSLLVPLAAYLGFMQNDSAVLVASLATLIAALVFLQVMVRQHRQGRMVMARAKTSVGRDVLTGLLSRQGFEQVLAKNVIRMHAEKVYAAFFYVTVSDAKTLQERFGDEGFEGGMVQMAAAISSSVSVVDTVGRVASNAFAVTVLMPRDAKLANSMAQKIITRTMSLASHGAPMAQTARIAIAWLPVFGTLLPDIERRAQRILRKMEEGKRIAWVGGEYAQMDLSQMPDGTSSPTTKPNNGQTADDDLPSLPGMINRIEQEMLGPDTEQLKSEADRLMRMMKANSTQPDFANTKVEARQPASRR
jgi:two-component system, sensor histidine kinase LadS